VQTAKDGSYTRVRREYILAFIVMLILVKMRNYFIENGKIF